MAARTAPPIPSTRVTSPSPTPTENSNSSYFAPITRSATKQRSATPSSTTISEDPDSDSSLEARARARSRSPETAKRRAARRRDSNASASSNSYKKNKSGIAPLTPASPNPIPETNGHLAPPSSTSSSFWRNFSPSRSPSPLGLIPIHRSFRTFIHKHEVPRKILHLSIGFVTLHLYTRGIPQDVIHPYLLAAFIPIATVDVLRLHHFPSLNKIYVRALGALMRESEVQERSNGVVWYLLGAWTVLRFFPKDVSVVSVLLLSWCDTAASTIGRAWGAYTPRVRKGKSLAGSAAALVTGWVAAEVFWGMVVPRWPFDDGFLFKGQLALPAVLGGEKAGSVGGTLALGIVSLWSGVVGAASEVVDLWGWDDNVTIPILSGLGLWGFLKVFAG